MKLPVIHEAVNMVIRGKNYLVTCMDVFDAGYGYHMDVLFPAALRMRFLEGEPCKIPGFGSNGTADFASHPKRDGLTVRFLISKWT